MSTINAQNYGDGTDSVPASAVLQGTAKFWVNLDSSTGTPTERNSFNVSSITDNGVGRNQLNFNNAFAAIDYSFSGAGQFDTTGVDENVPTIGIQRVSGRVSTSFVEMSASNNIGTSTVDVTIFTASGLGDLA